MKNKTCQRIMKRIAFMGSILLGSVLLAQQASAASFKDVPTNHSFYDAVEWAKSEKIFDGYQDNTFKPANTLTTAQFAKVVSNYFALQPVQGTIQKSIFVGVPNEPHWSDTYFDLLASYQAPITAYKDNATRDKPIARGFVALTLAHFTSKETGLDNAIQYLLTNGITTGQYPKYKDINLYRYFGTHNFLTRGQMAAFLHRMEQKNIAFNAASSAAEKRQQYDQTTDERTLTRFVNDSSQLIPAVMYERMVPNNIYDIIRTTGFEPYEKLDVNHIKSTTAFNKYWSRLSEQSKNAIYSKNGKMEMMLNDSFSLEFDNLHFFSLQETNYAQGSYTIFVSMNLLSATEIAKIISDLSGVTIHASQFNNLAPGKVERLFYNGKSYYAIYSSEEDEIMDNYSKETGISSTNHRFYKITFTPKVPNM